MNNKSGNNSEVIILVLSQVPWGGAEPGLLLICWICLWWLFGGSASVHPFQLMLSYLSCIWKAPYPWGFVSTILLLIYQKDYREDPCVAVVGSWSINRLPCLWCIWHHKPIKGSLCRLLWRLEALAFTADWFLRTYPSTYTGQIQVSHLQVGDIKTAKADIINERQECCFTRELYNPYTSQSQNSQFVSFNPLKSGQVVIPAGRHDNGVSWPLCVCFFWVFCFLFVSRATFGSKYYMSPSFWRWSVLFPSWSLWVDVMYLIPIVWFWSRVTHLIQLNRKDFKTGTVLHNPSPCEWLCDCVQRELLWEKWQPSRLKLYLLDRWFCLPSKTSSSLYFSIAGWPSTLWRTW